MKRVIVHEPADSGLPGMVAEEFRVKDEAVESRVIWEASRIFEETAELYREGLVLTREVDKAFEDFCYAETLAPAMKPGWGVEVNGWWISVEEG